MKQKVCFWFKCDQDKLIYLLCCIIYFEIPFWLLSWSVLVIFLTSGCANLHCRSLEILLIPLKLCMGQLRFCASSRGGNAYDVLVLMRSDWQALCPFLHSKTIAHFWSAQLSHPLGSSLVFQVPGTRHVPLTGSPDSRSPSTCGDVGRWPRCCLVPGLRSLYLPAWWLNSQRQFSACPSSRLWFSHVKSFTTLMANFVVQLHLIFQLENLIFSFSFLEVVI